MAPRIVVVVLLLAAPTLAATGEDLDRAVDRTLAQWDAPILAQAPSPEPSWPDALLRRPRRVALTLLSVSPGEMTYTTKGTVSDGSRSANTEYWRFLSEYFGGLEINWANSEANINGATKLQSFDFFAYGGYPSEPIEDLRFRPRLGFFYNEYNLKRAQAGDVEPHSLGIRFDLEAEFDIVHTTGFLVSVFASGRVGYGWGSASVVGSGSESSTMLGLGWQAGVRMHVEGLYAALSWLQRVDEYRASGRYSRAEYDFQGLTLSFGFRF